VNTHELAKILLEMPDRMCDFYVDDDTQLELNSVPFEDPYCELFIVFELDYSNEV